MDDMSKHYGSKHCLPRWREPWEVTREGLYILCRTDDNSLYWDGYWNEPLMVKVFSESDRAGCTYMVMRQANDMDCNVGTLDSECRLFGPIPDSPKEDDC